MCMQDYGILGGQVAGACTWDTPGRMPVWPCMPQLPVAMEYLSPLVIVSLFTAPSTLMSLPTKHHTPCTILAPHNADVA